jgi:hypothetical protein
VPTASSSHVASRAIRRRSIAGARVCRVIGVSVGVVAAGFLGFGGVSFACWTLAGSGNGSGSVAAVPAR